MYNLWDQCWISLATRIPLHPAVWQHQPVLSALSCIQLPCTADSSSVLCGFHGAGGETAETARAPVDNCSKAMARHWKNVSQITELFTSPERLLNIFMIISLPLLQLCRFIQASLHLTWKSICFVNSLFFLTSVISGITYLLCLLFFLKCPFVFFFPKFHIFQVQEYSLFSVFVKIVHLFSSSLPWSLLILLLLLWFR